MNSPFREQTNMMVYKIKPSLKLKVVLEHCVSSYCKGLSKLLKLDNIEMKLTTLKEAPGRHNLGRQCMVSSMSL